MHLEVNYFKNFIANTFKGYRFNGIVNISTVPTVVEF